MICCLQSSWMSCWLGCQISALVCLLTQPAGSALPYQFWTYTLLLSQRWTGCTGTHTAGSHEHLQLICASILLRQQCQKTTTHLCPISRSGSFRQPIPANRRPGYLSASRLLLALVSAVFFKLEQRLVVNITIPSWFRQSVRLLGSSRGQRKHSLWGICLRSLWICCYKQPIQ